MFGRCLAARAGRAPHGASSSLRHTATITIADELAIALEMDAMWDRAAEALSKGDFTGFDQAMLRFREIKSSREANHGD